MSAPATRRAVAAGMAKQIPWAFGMIAVFTPTTREWVSTSGPPELPGFSAASVWMMFSMSRPSRAWSERRRALTTPVVTVDWKPSGSPMAMTSCPTRSASESPRVTAGNTAALSARITARSVLGSEPTTDAASSVPSWSVMRGCAPPSTTCAFVSR